MNTPKADIKRIQSKSTKATKSNNQTTPRKRSTKKKQLSAHSLHKRLIFLTLEIVALVFTGFSAVIIALGYSANWFSGTSLFSSLLPFATGILVLIVATAFLLTGWHKLRKYLQSIKPEFIPILPIILALTISWFASQNNFTQAFGNFRTLVGGKQEAGRVTLAHQVYAAYRRYEQEQLTSLLKRAKQYQPAIEEAAKAYSLDPNLLQGVAATESSFLPRDSADGGRGLFQITQVPKAITAQVEKQIVEKISLNDARHNAFIAAATLKYYLAQMHGDLFLGLLAYNIGPANGGLKSIMQQYGATDFVTIQPYLQKLPRDYPIRVLSNALAFRIWQKEGKLLAYEEGNNALRIQSIGIPGLLLNI
ncbi:MAG: transglycosylase SLT domain-containing protein [Methylococcales bacterium]|nr:transglycosylase SLT domain-containing protein [Methylococcaceae bacterium]